MFAGMSSRFPVCVCVGGGSQKDTEEFLFNHFFYCAFVFAYTLHLVNLHGLLLCCQYISDPPAPANHWVV